ncbi:MAG: nucleoside 2-deoxyribosyltransferase [Deinococcota bacterium]
MTVYLGIKFHADNSNQAKIEALTDVLTECGLKGVCIQRDVEKWGEITLSSSDLMQKTFELIETCDLAIIDLTEKGVGLGIEAGYAYAKGIPVITIAELGSDISTTLTGISESVHHYQDTDELKQIFLRSLSLWLN